jgi:hypothetical protein
MMNSNAVLKSFPTLHLYCWIRVCLEILLLRFLTGFVHILRISFLFNIEFWLIICFEILFLRLVVASIAMIFSASVVGGL